MKLFQYGALIARMAETESRLANGRLDKPPELFVSCCDVKNDEYKIVPIDWLVAETLCPREMKRIGELIANERQARHLEAEKEHRAAQIDQRVKALRSGSNRMRTDGARQENGRTT